MKGFVIALQPRCAYREGSGVIALKDISCNQHIGSFRRRSLSQSRVLSLESIKYKPVYITLLLHCIGTNKKPFVSIQLH